MKQSRWNGEKVFHLPFSSEQCVCVSVSCCLSLFPCLYKWRQVIALWFFTVDDIILKVEHVRFHFGLYILASIGSWLISANRKAIGRKRHRNRKPISKHYHSIHNESIAPLTFWQRNAKNQVKFFGAIQRFRILLLTILTFSQSPFISVSFSFFMVPLLFRSLFLANIFTSSPLKQLSIHSKYPLNLFLWHTLNCIYSMLRSIKRWLWKRDSKGNERNENFKYCRLMIATVGFIRIAVVFMRPLK